MAQLRMVHSMAHQGCDFHHTGETTGMWDCPSWLTVYFPRAGSVGPEEEIKVAGPLPP